MDTEPVGKTQLIRVLDVLLIGPVMMRAAYELRASSPLLASVLGASGAATVVYNWANYVRQERRTAAKLRHVGAHVPSAELASALRDASKPRSERGR